MLNRPRAQVLLAGGLLVALAALTALPWRRFSIIGLGGTPVDYTVGEHTPWTDSWWWAISGVAGLLAAASLFVRYRPLQRLGLLAGLLALVSWSWRTWQLHHSSTSEKPMTVAIANFSPLPPTAVGAFGETTASYLAAAVLVLILVSSLLRWRNLSTGTESADGQE